jgi:hypothetical protein
MNAVPRTSGGQWQATLPVAGHEQYYRLQQQGTATGWHSGKVAVKKKIGGSGTR